MKGFFPHPYGRRGALLTALLAALLGGCQSSPTPNKDSAAATTAKATTAVAAATSAAPPLDGCPEAAGHKDDSCDHAAPAAGDQKHFGDPFSLNESQSLSAAVAGPAEARQVRVSGTVESVCKKAGCWMVLQDGDLKARVFTKQNRFFLPQRVKGKQATVEGKLQARTVTERFAKHLEADRGGDPSKIKGESREWVLYASAVEVL